MMIKKTVLALSSFMLFGILSTSPALAGQVITDEMRSWAKGAMEQEKLLKPTAEPNTVAITYFNNKTEKSDMDILQKGLAIMLITDLSKIKGLQVVERARMQAIAEELGLGVSGLVEPGSSARVGRLLKAEYVIGGDILKNGPDKFKLNSGLLKVSDGEMVSEPTAQGQLLDGLFQMEKDLLFSLIDGLKIQLSEEEKTALKKPITNNIKALLHLIEGIEHSDRNNYDQAADSYEKALQEDPNLGPAKDALGELRELGLIGKVKKNHKLLKSLRDRTSLTDQLSPEYPTKRAKKPDALQQPIDQTPIGGPQYPIDNQ